MLRKHLRTEQGKSALQNQILKNANVLQVVLDLITPSLEKIEDLEGCHIVPLANDTLGTLWLRETLGLKAKYHVTTEHEQELFKFASRAFLSCKYRHAYSRILNCEKFNIYPLKNQHVGKLMAMRKTAHCVTPGTYQWLSEFWEFWNKSAVEVVPPVDIDLNSLGPVFRAVNKNSVDYREYWELDTLPAVITPVVLQQSQLCQNIPGLIMFDNKFMPNSFQDSEGSLSSSVSFPRFLRAVQSLSAQMGKGFTQFLVEHLDKDSFEVGPSLVS